MKCSVKTALGQSGKAAFMEYLAIDDHVVTIEDTNLILYFALLYTRLHQKVFELYNHDNSFNRKEEILLNKAWYPGL